MPMPVPVLMPMPVPVPLTMPVPVPVPMLPLPMMPSENRFAYADKPGGAQQKQQFRGAGHTRRSNRVKRSIFTITEFNLIISCLHPDGERTEERKKRAFILFNSKKLVLTGVR